MNRAPQNKQPKPIPVEYAGQVIAWDSADRDRVVGVGKSYDEARQAAKEAGVDTPLLQRVPRTDRTFVGLVA